NRRRADDGLRDVHASIVPDLSPAETWPAPPAGCGSSAAAALGEAARLEAASTGQGRREAELDVPLERLGDRAPVLGAFGGLPEALGVQPRHPAAHRQRARDDPKA